MYLCSRDVFIKTIIQNTLIFTFDSVRTVILLTLLTLLNIKSYLLSINIFEYKCGDKGFILTTHLHISLNECEVKRNSFLSECLYLHYYIVSCIFLDVRDVAA